MNTDPSGEMTPAPARLIKDVDEAEDIFKPAHWRWRRTVPG
jgi:hypothetical protein